MWARKYGLELLWGLFAAANLVALVLFSDYETIPLHFVYVSLALVYGYRLWRLRTTTWTLLGVSLATAASLWVIARGPHGFSELAEIPLMGAMFLTMVWHAERRRLALAQVRQAAERERDFLRDASHQLKTPITIALAHTELIRHRHGPQVELDVISDELRRLSRIAEGLLFLAATEESNGLAPSTFATRDVISDLERRWTASADRGWSFECKASGTILADRANLVSALDALLQNAVEASDTGDGVSVVCHGDGDTAVFEVSDTGVGIPVEVVPKVFDRFWSARRPECLAGRGTGLGLPIVKAVAEAHGGFVAVRSEHGSGATFVLSLPRYSRATKASDSRGPAGPAALGSLHARALQKARPTHE